MSDLIERALTLAAAGVPVFPCLASKAPAEAGAGGFLSASTDAAEVRRTFALPGVAHIGIPTGQKSGVDVLDLDPRHGSDSWPDRHRLPATRVRRTGGGGRHYLFRHAEGLGCSVSRIAPGVDVRADGGYAVAWPDVDPAAPILDWPAWLLDAARTPARAPAADISHIDRPPSARAVVDLLDRLPNPASNGRDVWLAVMLAAVGCAQALDDDSGIAEAACRWAARWPGSPGYDVESAKWESDFQHRDRPLAGWRNLVSRANREIPGYAVEKALAEFAAVPLPPEPAALVPVVRGGSMRSRFLFPADCANGPKRGYLVKRLIAPGDVAAIIGPPGCGKSMLGPFIGYAVAQGRAVFGLRTKPGRTLYVAAEDATGMRQRIHALRLHHGDAPDFAMVDCGNLRDPATSADLRTAVDDWRPALVVIDTLGAAFAGGDENSAQDMGQVVELARALAATGCAVVLIHHTAKHGDGSPRGHGVLNGTLDMSLSLAPRDESGVIRCTMLKNRNGTTDRNLAFRFIAVPLGSDEDGDPVTAPMCVELDAADARAAAQPRLSPTARRALAVLADIADSDGQATDSAWRARCDDARVSPADSPDSRARAIRRAFSELLDAGQVTATGGLVRLAHGGGQRADKVDVALSEADEACSGQERTTGGQADNAEKRLKSAVSGQPDNGRTSADKPAGQADSRRADKPDKGL